MKTKQNYRTTYSILRNGMPLEQVIKYSDTIIDLLLPQIEEADTFFIYLSTGNEVRTYDIIKLLLEEGKTVTVPKIISKGTMEPYKIESLNHLSLGQYGILQPTTKIYKGEIDIGITPGVVFSEDLERIGRG